MMQLPASGPGGTTRLLCRFLLYQLLVHDARPKSGTEIDVPFSTLFPHRDLVDAGGEALAALREDAGVDVEAQGVALDLLAGADLKVGEEEDHAGPPGGGPEPGLPDEALAVPGGDAAREEPGGPVAASGLNEGDELRQAALG